MANMDSGWASTLLAATLTNSTTVASTVWPAITGPPAITLISGTVQTSSFSSAGTEFSTANGYTAHGQSLGANVFTTVSTTTNSTYAQITGPGTSAVSWTASGSGLTSIYGLEIWTPGTTHTTRWWWGTWTGAPITVASGNTFQIAVNAITIQLG